MLHVLCFQNTGTLITIIKVSFISNKERINVFEIVGDNQWSFRIFTFHAQNLKNILSAIVSVYTSKSQF